MKIENARFVFVRNEESIIKQIDSESELKEIFNDRINLTDIFTIDEVVYSVDAIGLNLDNENGLNLEITIHAKFYDYESNINKTPTNRTAKK